MIEKLKKIYINSLNSKDLWFNRYNVNYNTRAIEIDFYKNFYYWILNNCKENLKFEDILELGFILGRLHTDVYGFAEDECKFYFDDLEDLKQE